VHGEERAVVRERQPIADARRKGLPLKAYIDCTPKKGVREPHTGVTRELAQRPSSGTVGAVPLGASCEESVEEQLPDGEGGL
jgi:hypothetical protein